MFIAAFEKVATADHHPALTPPAKGVAHKLTGPMGGSKPMAVPTRVTPTMSPGNPVHGLKGLTGATAQAPFAQALGTFGRQSKKGIVSRTGALRGIKI